MAVEGAVSMVAAVEAFVAAPSGAAFTGLMVEAASAVGGEVIAAVTVGGGMDAVGAGGMVLA
jgi:hypothetical protein